MNAHAIVLTMALIEGVNLAQIVDDFRALLGDRDEADPAVRRLTPSAYPDDEAAAASFADATHDDHFDRRLADVAKVQHALSRFDADIDTLTEDEALAPQELEINGDDVDAWLRTITAIRLVIAERLGIVNEDHGADDAGHGVYDWLGYRLEVLIQAADESEARRGR